MKRERRSVARTASRQAGSQRGWSDAHRGPNRPALLSFPHVHDLTFVLGDCASRQTHGGSRSSPLDRCTGLDCLAAHRAYNPRDDISADCRHVTGHIVPAQPSSRRERLPKFSRNLVSKPSPICGAHGITTCGKRSDLLETQVGFSNGLASAMRKCGV